VKETKNTSHGSFSTRPYKFTVQSRFNIPHSTTDDLYTQPSNVAQRTK